MSLSLPRLKDFAEAYEVVKSERNKTHTQIQTMTQVQWVTEPSQVLTFSLATVGRRAQGEGEDPAERDRHPHNVCREQGQVSTSDLAAWQ